MIVFDASALIAHLEADDPQHLAGVALMRASAGRLRRIPALTLAEVLIGFERAGRADEALSDILGALRFEEIATDAGFARRVAKVRVETGLKLPDAVVLAEARRLDATIATLDNRLATVAQAENRRFDIAA